MDKVRARINNIIKRVDRRFGSSTNNEEKLAAFNELLTTDKAIYVLYHEVADTNKRLKEVQTTLKQINKYNARSMTLIQYIKFKLTTTK